MISIFDESKFIYKAQLINLAKGITKPKIIGVQQNIQTRAVFLLDSWILFSLNFVPVLLWYLLSPLKIRSKIKNKKAISFKKLMLNIDVDYILLSRIILWLSKYVFISLEDEK